MTNKEIVLENFPDAVVCCGDDPDSRIIMRPGQVLSDEHLGTDDFDEDSAEKNAWFDAAQRILSTLD